jgi:hypothetical protein
MDIYVSKASMMWDIASFIAQPYNNPVGADCQEIFVVLQRLLAAAQPERWVAFRLH